MNITILSMRVKKRRNLALGISYFGDCSSQKQQKSVFNGCKGTINFYSDKHFMFFVDSRGNIEDYQTPKGEFQIDDQLKI